MGVWNVSVGIVLPLDYSSQLIKSVFSGEFSSMKPESPAFRVSRSLLGKHSAIAPQSSWDCDPRSKLRHTSLMCTHCPWLLWRYACFWVCSHQSHITFPSKLVTGKPPFPESLDSNIRLLLSEGKRPQEPGYVWAPGITPGVWKVAEMCWHDEPKERPPVHTVLQDLEDIANAGGYTRTSMIIPG